MTSCVKTWVLVSSFASLRNGASGERWAVHVHLAASFSHLEAPETCYVLFCAPFSWLQPKYFLYVFYSFVSRRVPTFVFGHIRQGMVYAFWVLSKQKLEHKTSLLHCGLRNNAVGYKRMCVVSVWWSQLAASGLWKPPWWTEHGGLTSTPED